MNNLQHQDFQHFAAAFFNTVEEHHIYFSKRQRLEVISDLAAMPLLWFKVDRFNQIRNAEKLAVRFARRHK